MATIGRADEPVVIRTPDRRLRVFVSSTLGELSDERSAVRIATEQQRLSPVMFELGARPHPPRQLYRAYLEQSDIFVGIYWQRYGWVAPGEEVSGLEDEYLLAERLPRLIYIKEPAPEREPRLVRLLGRIKSDDRSSYKRFADSADLARLVADDLAVLLAERFDAGAVRTLPSTVAATLPVPLTETIGRGAAINELVALLRDGTRLLTLTGPGGVGKTRLAQDVARTVATAYPRGAHLVALAPVTDPALVMRTVADRLGIAVEGTQDPSLALADRLSGAATLIVLDNLEQVAAVGPELVLLLERCPLLQIIATSRQALRVRGEREWPVAPLPVPPADTTTCSLEDEPAVQLFVRRARDAGGGFVLDDGNAEAVAELSRRLDGLPLAIELAAARTRLLPPAVLLSRLDARLDALGTGGPDRPARQRTMHAAVGWSHDLLDERERAVFARLGVFAGSFSLAAAEAVCGDDNAADDLDTLASLVDKSLVTPAETTDAGEPRLQLLETVRSYARQRLEEHGESARARRRHLDWYRAFGRRAQPYLCGPGQREWAARFDPERANLRAAVRAAQEFEDDDAVIELTWYVIVYFFVRDAVHEPESWLEHISSAGRPLDRVSQAKLDSLLALMRIHRGELAGTRAALESALAVFRSEQMDFETAVTLKELAWVRYADDDSLAVADLEESSRVFEAIGHDWGVALAEVQLTSVLLATGDLVRAERRVRRSLECSQRIENRPLIAQALQHEAMMRVLDGHRERVVPLVDEAAGLLRDGSHQTEAAACLDVLAASAAASGAYGPALRALTVADAVRRRIGISLWPTDRSFVARVIDDVREHTAAGEFEAAAATAVDADVFDVLSATLAALRSTSERM